MSMDDEQPATLTAAESSAPPAPGQPQKMKADNNSKAVLFSIGPNQQQPTSQVGAPHTNADVPKDSGAQPEPLKIPSQSSIFQTNADIPQEMAAGPPFSAPPTPAHKHGHTVGKQFSSPLFSNIKETSEALDESQHIYSQFSETGPKDEYKSQVSVIDLPSGIYPAHTQKVSMEDEAIMQRQQQRFKMIEEQNKTKSLQFKQTYSDPYSYKSTERVQSKQRRAQG